MNRNISTAFLLGLRLYMVVWEGDYYIFHNDPEISVEFIPIWSNIKNIRTTLGNLKGYKSFSFLNSVNNVFVSSTPIQKRV